MPVYLLFLCVFQAKNTPTAPVTLLLDLWKSTSKCQAHPSRNVIQPPAEYETRRKALVRLHGDPQTVNKDQTMLPAAGFELNVFSVLPAEITARDGRTNRSSPPESRTTSISVFQSKASNQFCHYTCLLWCHRFLHFSFLALFSAMP